MLKMRKTEEIRAFILNNVERHPGDITALVASAFSISRQAAHRHVDKLVKEHSLQIVGATRDRKYSLVPIFERSWSFVLENLAEDKVWRDSLAPVLQDLPANVLKICQYGLTEMVNNAIDHSGGQALIISVLRTPASVELNITDDGVGIFNKIKQKLGLDDVLHAILELSKGKLTTDPQHHSGEGIFFTSRVFDKFSIRSGELFFHHDASNGQDEVPDWLLETKGDNFNGTAVSMSVSVNTTRTTREVFDAYSVDGDFGFSKTHVPVFLAQYGDENLISRSQAKRLLTRFERFKEIVLDFQDVDSIGQAFADEIFRVFKNTHPEVHLFPVRANTEVLKMIMRVTAQSQG
jgi:anti-sigma regulatory factor (Ser/Thr protein kinase)